MTLGTAVQPVRYRVLCLSRNLTFDRSWDTALVLDGELRNRKYAIHVNHPIGDFFEALPGMAVRGVTEEVQEPSPSRQRKREMLS